MKAIPSQNDGPSDLGLFLHTFVMDAEPSQN
jgi:hypothetical protein